MAERVRLTVDAYAQLDLGVAQVEGGLAHGRGGAGAQPDAEGAAAGVDLLGHSRDLPQRCSGLGHGSGDLLDEDRGTGAPAARRMDGVVHGDVVVDQYGRHLYVLLGGELGGHLEVQDVARVVLHDVQHPGAAVHRRGGLDHLVGHGRGEDLPGTGRVEHAVPDEADVQWFVPGTSAGHQADLAGTRSRGAVNDPVLLVHPQPGMRGRETAQRVRYDRLDVVDELFHSSQTVPVRRRWQALTWENLFHLVYLRRKLTE
jgi:hypothetical protein